MTKPSRALRRILVDLRDLRRRAAVVGGVAISARLEPRFTRDVDLAVMTSGDEDSERLVFQLQEKGYRVLATVERADGRLATARLSHQRTAAVIIDLLFASCGIETEVVEAAEPIAVFRDTEAPVARNGHLLAMKLLARSPERPNDAQDIVWLVAALDETERERARAAVALIEERGFARAKQLRAELEAVLEAAGRG